MRPASSSVPVYLEIGTKKTFAGSVDWPGWVRGGRDESSALQALLAYGPRYARVLALAGLGFQSPQEVSAFQVIERLAGNATTDFGAPDRPLSGDSAPLDGAELLRFEHLLKACWLAFDAAVQAATGKELRKGPRGGGRELPAIVRHVLESDRAYLSVLGWKIKWPGEGSPEEDLRQTRQAIQDALAAAARGELPAAGPRGGVRWPPRYFVRRSAWHILDHAWEIEERIL